jgi:L-fuconolactonase
MLVDAHFHFWKSVREDYWWFREMPELNRDFMESDYDPLRLGATVDKSIIVQALETETETEFMLELAAKHDWIFGVIGWVNFESENAPMKIAALANRNKFLGLRNWAVGRVDKNWLSSGILDGAFSAIIDTALTYDALVGPDNLGALVARLKRNPNLKLCINHCAYPLPEWEIGGPQEIAWQQNLKILADLGAAIKFSGFGHKTNGVWLTTPYDRHVSFVLNCFAPHKIIWASNWPTVVKECSFDEWLMACKSWTAHMSIEDQAKIYGAAAETFYGI